MLSLVVLDRLEAEIGARLHDDILVQLALRDPIVELFTGIGDPSAIADAADEHEAPEGWVCISTVYSDPVGERVAGAHGGAYYYLAVPREPSSGEARILVGADGLDAHAEVAADEADTLSTFLHQAFHEASSAEHGERCSFVRPERAEPLVPVPALIEGRRLKRRDGAGEAVTHPKFGAGTVVRREGGGEHEKLVVRFADGERTLLARFVGLAREKPGG